MLRSITLHDWQTRCKHLVDTRLGLTQALKHMDEAKLAGVLAPLCDGLCMQLRDLRANVIKEVCDTIEVLAKTLKVHFDVFQLVIVQLCSLARRKQRVLTTTADACLRVILTNCHTPPLLSALFEAVDLFRSKSGAIEICCCHYFELVTLEWPRAMLQGALTQLQKILIQFLTHAHAGVRKAARSWLFRFCCVWSGLGGVIYCSLPGLIQQAVLQEYPDFDPPPSSFPDNIHVYRAHADDTNTGTISKGTHQKTKKTSGVVSEGNAPGSSRGIRKARGNGGKSGNNTQSLKKRPAWGGGGGRDRRGRYKDKTKATRRKSMESTKAKKQMVCYS